MDIFPGATHVFTVQREGIPVLQGQNYVPASTFTIALTGVSIQLKPMIGMEEALQSGIVTEGKYIASTFTGTPICNQDVLLDEAYNNNDGTPVAYVVKDSYDNGLYLRMFLQQKALGG